MINERAKDLTKVVNAFTVYKFIKMMVEPFENTNAYELGIIDRKGKFLKKTHELTTNKELESVD